MGSSPKAIWTPRSVVLLAVVVFCASSAIAQQYKVPNCVHKPLTIPSHRTYKEVSEESVFETPNQLMLHSKQIMRNGVVVPNVTVASYLVVAQWPKPDTKLNAGDVVDIIVVDTNDLVAEDKKLFHVLLIVGAAIVGLFLGWGLRALKKP